ncbi:hypothetical protein R6Q59_010189 [Mikania micrantha]
MNETPRLRSAFPATPQTNVPRFRGFNDARRSFPSPPSSQPRASPITRPVQSAIPTKQSTNVNGPLISLDVIDAPTQRFYVLAFYFLLLGWRLYNAWNVTDDLDSTWLFLKWLGIDAAFFVALPAFKIPWLEWSFFTTITIWILHVVANAFLMYRIPIPVFAWLGALVKVAYDRELSISELRVKPANILHNSSIILGKQIIQILPEGSAVLNPEKLSFCLDESRTSIELPIQINQTTPISIELVRHDLATEEVESITIGSKQARKLKKEADRRLSKADVNKPRILHYQVSKTGLYQLARVIDESKLDVRKRSYDVAVVACPKASVLVDVKDKCMGDLSSVSLHVEGIPPFKVRYSKRVNLHASSSIVQTVQPDDTDSELAGDSSSNAVTDPKHPHRGWTKSRKVSVQINEALNRNGTWSYHIEEVEDGLANRATIDPDRVKKDSTDRHSGSMIVHLRPVIALSSCSVQQPLLLGVKETAMLPIKVTPQGQLPAQDWPLKLTYTFHPETDTQIALVEQLEHKMTNDKHLPRIDRAGRYDLESVASQFCQGEVQEPSSCPLRKVPPPDLAMEHEEIADKCAGNSIGMRVNLEFTGTPPFTVRYTEKNEDTGETRRTSQTFDKMRGQLTFRPKSAGSYTYQLHEIDDRIYMGVSMDDRKLVLAQKIRPPANAGFQDNRKAINVCLDEPVNMPVGFQGEGPWDLEYEVVHGNKRKKFNLHSESDHAVISFPGQIDGGRYAVELTSVQDRSKCKQSLAEERYIDVRSERPYAAFGDVEGRRTVTTKEGAEVKMPLRLRGAGPWTVHLQNVERGSAPVEYKLTDVNAMIKERMSGTYELISVHDRCPGVVDAKANKFQITWIERPTLHLRDSSVSELGGNSYRKAPVCLGDEDTLSLALTGTPPYGVKYQQKHESSRGSAAVSNKEVSVATNNMVVNMDTSRAGDHTYTFNKLQDNRYNHDSHHFSGITVKQEVHPLPTAKFSNPGRTYGYCKDDPGLTQTGEVQTEKIPIELTGTPPFSLEIAISHHGASQRPETIRIRDVQTTSYTWSLSRAAFELGTHKLQIRGVKDARGCESSFDPGFSTVQIHVSAPPTINPLESTTDYCVGDRVSFSLSGQAPFDVFYTFQNRERKAPVTSNEFKRITDSPGDFVITGISDAAMGGGGKCKASKNIRKTIHPYPTVKISQGRTMISDIHEGGEVDIHFEFTGTPPFEFTYTRSENAKRGDKKKPVVLETRHDTSAEFTKTIRASEEGTYEVIAIKDRFCAYSAITGARSLSGGSAAKGVGWKDQKMLKND